MEAHASTLKPATQPEGAFARIVTAFPGAAAAAALLVGDLVLFGWRSDIDAYTSLIPGSVAMNPMTAFALALAGLSLWLKRDEDRSAWETRLGDACAWAVASIGALRLVGYLAGWNRGVDTLLFAEKLELHSGAWRSRMSPNTAVVCILIGASIALLSVRSRPRRAPQYLSVAALLVTLLALVGSAYGAAPIYGLTAFKPLTPHTAAAFTLLGVGILCARPHQGLVGILTTTPGGAAALRLLPVILGLPVALGWLTLAGHRMAYYDAPTGAALFVVATISLLATVAFRFAHLVDRSHAGPADVALEVKGMSHAQWHAPHPSLRSIAEEVIADQHDRTAGRPFEWHIGPLPDVDGDTAMLRQVFVDLIRNAVKATETRTPAVIEIGSIEGDGTEVVVFVRDNGVGFEGPGMGLTSVRQSVERFGGRTWSEGRPDRGAIFYVALPAAIAVKARAS